MPRGRRKYELSRLPTLEEVRDQRNYVRALGLEVWELEDDSDEQNRVAARLMVEENRLKRMLRTFR